MMPRGFEPKPQRVVKGRIDAAQEASQRQMEHDGAIPHEGA
jgi:hypothetical protein